VEHLGELLDQEYPYYNQLRLVNSDTVSMLYTRIQSGAHLCSCGPEEAL